VFGVGYGMKDFKDWREQAAHICQIKGWRAENEYLRKLWYVALEEGNLERCKQLFHEDINMILDEDTAPLPDAAENGCFDFCKWLILDRGMFACWKNAWGYSALSAASKNGHLKICELLLEHGAEAGGIGPNEPFAMAMQNSHLDVCKLLLKSGFKIDRRRRSVLWEAEASGYLNKVERFIEKYGES